MNDNLNTYGFGDEVYLYTWMEETRDWREHTHEHIEEVKDTIIRQILSMENNIKTEIGSAKNEILSSVNNVQTYLSETMKPILDNTNTMVTTNNGVLNNIWDKIEKWQ